MLIGNFTALMVTHYLADFCLQTKFQADNKAEDFGALLRHTATYSMCMLFTYIGTCALSAVPISGWVILGFIFAVCFMHAVIDRFTSIWSHEFADEHDYHNMFVVIGADQLIHILTIAMFC